MPSMNGVSGTKLNRGLTAPIYFKEDNKNGSS